MTTSDDKKILETVTRTDTNVGHLLAAVEDQEHRIRSLERWKWSHALSGAAILAIFAKLGIPVPGGGH